MTSGLCSLLAVAPAEPAVLAETAIASADVLRTLANGLRVGLLVAVMAVGVSLIFRTTGIVNLAHGALAAVGAVAAFLLNTRAVGPQVHLALATVVAVVLVAAIGGALEYGLWRPLRRRCAGALRTHLVVIGVALILQSLVIGGYFWSLDEIRPYHHFAVQPPIHLGALRVTPRDLVLIALSAALLGVVGLLLQRTRLGAAIRAVGDAPELAVYAGIDLHRVRLTVWVVAAGLAALAGVGVGISENVGTPMDLRLLVLVLAGVIIGGIGTYGGVIVGSLVIGVATEMSVLWFSDELKLVWAVVLLVLVLWRRPAGLLPGADRWVRPVHVDALARFERT